MNRQLQFRQTIELILGQTSTFGGTLTALKPLAQWQMSVVEVQFRQQRFDLRRKFPSLADFFQRGLGGLCARADGEELFALEFAAARRSVGIERTGAITMIERRTRLGDTWAVFSEQRRIVATLASDIGK